MVKCQRLIGLRLSLLLVVVAAAGCGEGGDSGSVAPAATQADEQPTQAVEEDAIDLTRLPLGDGKVSTRPVAGSVFACQTRFGGGGAFQDGPWISGDGTWDLTAKAVVDGEVAWPGEFSESTQNRRPRKRRRIEISSTSQGKPNRAMRCNQSCGPCLRVRLTLTYRLPKDNERKCREHACQHRHANVSYPWS